MKSLKPSTRQRFVALDFGYPPEEAEVAIVAAESGLPAQRCRPLILLAHRLRALADVDLEEGCSTRLVVYAAALIVGGMRVEDAVRAAMIEPLTDDVETRRGPRRTHARDPRLSGAVGEIAARPARAGGIRRKALASVVDPTGAASLSRSRLHSRRARGPRSAWSFAASAGRPGLGVAPAAPARQRNIRRAPGRPGALPAGGRRPVARTR